MNSLQDCFPFLLDLMLKSTLVLSLALLCNRLLTRMSSARQHAILLSAFGVLLILPAASHFLASLRQHSGPTNDHAVLVIRIPAEKSPEPNVAMHQDSHGMSGRRTSLNWQTIASSVWLAGTALLLGMRVLAEVRLLLWRVAGNRATDLRLLTLCEHLTKEFGIARKVTLLISTDHRGAMTWGSLRPVVSLPKGADKWPDEKLALVLRHELAHVKRQDCLARLITHIARAIHWPNPLVWIAARNARLTQEHACDDHVLSSGAQPDVYAMELVSAARELGDSRIRLTATMADPSTLERRIMAILGHDLDRRALRRPVTFLVAVGSLLAVIGGATLEVRAQKTPPIIRNKITEIPQVSISARFVEFKNLPTMSTPEDFWTKPDAQKPGSVVKTLNHDQIEQALQRLQKISGVHMMSTPTVTVKAGQPANISIAQQLRYPISWRKSSDGNLWEPAEFATRDVGVSMIAQAELTGDDMLSLSLAPEMVDFEGYLGHELPPPAELQAKSANASSENTDRTMENSREWIQSVFKVRTISTIIRLRPGQTVVLRGGPSKIETLPTINRDNAAAGIETNDSSWWILVTARVLQPAAAQ